MKKILIFLFLAFSKGVFSQTYTLPALQTIDYRWHIRGGLSGINLDASGNPNPNISEGDLFSYQLDYETTGQWAGNIGKQTWVRANTINYPCDPSPRSFTYTFDPSIRLKSATYAGVGAENYTITNIDYDRNGNIKTLQRNGWLGSSFGQMDNLTYTHEGNQLKAVTDAVAGNHTVDLVPRGTGNRTFYSNGALKADQNKEIDLIVYDPFTSLPIEINLTGGRKIKISIKADGTVLSREYSVNGTVLETWIYDGDIVFKNGEPYSMTIPEGRALYKNGQWDYEFFIKDHLDNVRVTFANESGQLKAREFSDVDAWGLPLANIGKTQNATVNNFQFLNREKINWVSFYDLKKRHYDATIGIFNAQDPIIESQESLSLYQYGWNNPVLRSDPNGDCPVCPFVLPYLPAIGTAIAEAAIATGATAVLYELVKNAKPFPGSGYSPAVGFAMSSSKPGELTTLKANSNNSGSSTSAPSNKPEKKVPNPDGAKGKPDHQEKVKELEVKATKENPGKSVITEKKIQAEGSNRRPDVQVVDPKTGKTTKIYEAERRPESKRNQNREAEYKKLDIPNETHKIGN